MGFGTCVPDNAVSVLQLCCPRSFRLSFCSHLADRKHHAVQPFFLFLQLYRGQFLLSVHSAQHMLSVACSEAAKRQNTKKRIYSSNNRGSGKVETADSPWNFGQIFPTDRLWKVFEKWKAFSTREKWKVCGVENKSLWKKSWKTCRTRNTASTSCGKHIPQLSTTDSTSPLLQLSNAADTAGTFSAHEFSTDC